MRRQRRAKFQVYRDGVDNICRGCVKKLQPSKSQRSKIISFHAFFAFK